MGKRCYRAPVFTEDDSYCASADWGYGPEKVVLGPHASCMSMNFDKTEILVMLQPEDTRAKPRTWVELTEEQYATEFETNEERPPEAWER